MARIALQCNPDPRFAVQRRGVIPGVTPDDGVEVGGHVLIDDRLLTYLSRPTGEENARDFATYLAALYNTNLRFRGEPIVRWEVLELPDEEPAAPVVPQTPGALDPPCATDSAAADAAQGAIA